MEFQTTEEALARLDEWKNYDPSSVGQKVSKRTAVPIDVVTDLIKVIHADEAKFGSQTVSDEAFQKARIELGLKNPSSYAELLPMLVLNERICGTDPAVCSELEGIYKMWTQHREAREVKSFVTTLNTLKRIALSETYETVVSKAGRGAATLRDYIKTSYTASQAHVDAFWLSSFNAPVRLVTIFRHDLDFIDSSRPTQKVGDKLVNCCQNSKVVRSFAADYRNAAAVHSELKLHDARLYSQRALTMLIDVVGIDAIESEEGDLATGGYSKLFKQVVAKREATSMFGSRPPSHAQTILNQIFK